MPTYQYRCTACGHDLEATQKFSDPSLTECPNCGGSLRKVFNAVGVVFKGSGFYRTDSRKAGSERQRVGFGRLGAGRRSPTGTRSRPRRNQQLRRPAAASPSRAKPTSQQQLIHRRQGLQLDPVDGADDRRPRP